MTLAHAGPKADTDAFDLLYRHEVSRPNERWQADHTQLDLWVCTERGRPARPWLTVILDDYSRAVAGIRAGFEAPSALRTALTLRQAIWRKSEPHWHISGIPATFYTDHGSDFTSQHLEQVAADLKMRLVFSTVGEPRGRGKIERFFESVNQLGLCYGLPGVGKTLSVRHYADRDRLEPFIAARPHLMEPPVVPEAATCRSVYYTPGVTTTPKQLSDELTERCIQFSWTVKEALHPAEDRLGQTLHNWIELVLVDEADRLKMPTLEQLRDFYDRRQLGLVLIGMPGIEKSLARYAQFYSRVGFVHHFRTLSDEEVQFILAHHWQRLGLTLSPADFTDAEAIAAVARITGGNFRLVQRLFTQIERILQITKEVVHAARENLVIGPS